MTVAQKGAAPVTRTEAETRAADVGRSQDTASTEPPRRGGDCAHPETLVIRRPRQAPSTNLSQSAGYGLGPTHTPSLGQHIGIARGGLIEAYAASATVSLGARLWTAWAAWAGAAYAMLAEPLPDLAVDRQGQQLGPQDHMPNSTMLSRDGAIGDSVVDSVDASDGHSEHHADVVERHDAGLDHGAVHLGAVDRTVVGDTLARVDRDEALFLSVTDVDAGNAVLAPDLATGRRRDALGKVGNHLLFGLHVGVEVIHGGLFFLAEHLAPTPINIRTGAPCATTSRKKAPMSRKNRGENFDDRRTDTPKADRNPVRDDNAGRVVAAWLSEFEASDLVGTIGDVHIRDLVVRIYEAEPRTQVAADSEQDGDLLGKSLRYLTLFFADEGDWREHDAEVIALVELLRPSSASSAP